MLFPVMFNATNRLANDEHFVVGEVVAFGPVAWSATGDNILGRVSQQWIKTVESATSVVQLVAAVVTWLLCQFRVFLEWNRELMVTTFSGSSRAVKATYDCHVRCPLLVAIARIAPLGKTSGILWVAFAEFSQRLIDTTSSARLICRGTTLIAHPFEWHEFGRRFFSVTLKACSSFFAATLFISSASALKALTSTGTHVVRRFDLIARCASRESTKAFLADLAVQRKRCGRLVTNATSAFSPVIRIIALLRHAIFADATQPISRRSFVELIERLNIMALSASPTKAETFRTVLRVERKCDGWKCFQACSALLVARAIDQFNAVTALVIANPVKVIQSLRSCTMRADSIFPVAVFAETRIVVLTSVVSQFALARFANRFHWKPSFRVSAA